jgi:hypothetical protein
MKSSASTLNHKKINFSYKDFFELFLVNRVLKNHVPFKRYFKKSDLIFNVQKFFVL